MRKEMKELSIVPYRELVIEAKSMGFTEITPSGMKDKGAGGKKTKPVNHL